MSSAQYIAIDLKSFYASVECVDRQLDPLDTNLVVADENRTDGGKHAGALRQRAAGLSAAEPDGPAYSRECSKRMWQWQEGSDPCMAAVIRAARRSCCSCVYP